MTHEPSDAETTINGSVERLAVRFPAQSATTIRGVVTHAYEELNDARVRDFVEVLVEKQAKKRLNHMEDELPTRPAEKSDQRTDDILSGGSPAAHRLHTPRP